MVLQIQNDMNVFVFHAGSAYICVCVWEEVGADTETKTDTAPSS